MAMVKHLIYAGDFCTAEAIELVDALVKEKIIVKVKYRDYIILARSETNKTTLKKLLKKHAEDCNG